MCFHLKISSSATKWLLACLWLQASLTVFAQTTQDSGSSVALLNKDFPQLWEKFGTRAQAQKADYVIALDVSGSMNRFRDTVIDNVSSFLKALPDGDYVSILTFGTEVKIAGVPTEVNAGSRAAIREALQTVTFREQNTDMEAMAAKVLDELNRPGGNDMKFVFAFTDFDHDPPPLRRGQENWDKLAKRFKAEHAGRQVGFFAMKLQLSEKSGRDLTRIQQIFPSIQEIPVNPATLGGWFQRRKAEVLRDRLQFIVSKAMTAELPWLTARAEGSGIFVSQVPAKNHEIIQGIRILSAKVESVDGPHVFQAVPMPFSPETNDKGGTLLAAMRSGPYVEAPVAPPKISLQTEWTSGISMTELGHLGFQLPLSPSQVDPEGMVTAPGRLSLRASSSMVEGRLEGAMKDVSLRIDSLNLPVAGIRIELEPLPIVVGGDWIPLARVPITGLVSKSVGAGEAEGTAAFVTDAMPNAPAGGFKVAVPGTLASGRFALWQLGCCAGLASVLFIYLLVVFRPRKKFFGKLNITPPAPRREVSLKEVSSITLMRGSRDKWLTGVADAIPDGLRVVLCVRGHLLHPIKGCRCLTLESGSAELTHKSGRIERKAMLKPRQTVKLSDDIREFEIRSGGWTARWSRN